eukprot:scaffold5276_cov134-Cylindrotheca_fusiformis.AAC.3
MVVSPGSQVPIITFREAGQHVHRTNSMNARFAWAAEHERRQAQAVATSPEALDPRSKSPTNKQNMNISTPKKDSKVTKRITVLQIDEFAVSQNDFIGKSIN